MTPNFRSLLLLGLAGIFLTACGTNTVHRTRGTGYIAGTVRDRDNIYGRGITEKETSQVMKEDRVSYWDGDGINGPPGVTIDLSQQRAYFYKGNQLVGVSKISSGNSKYPTRVGDFKVTQKSKDHESNLYGSYVYPNGAIARKDIDTTKVAKPPGTIYDGTDMPYFMRFDGGIGMHGGYLPGYAASHGCIRMPQNMARIFFENVNVGTPVKVIP